MYKTIRQEIYVTFVKKSWMAKSSKFMDKKRAKSNVHYKNCSFGYFSRDE